ncbi:MAG: hypothetical protein ACOC1E_03485 [Marinilabiliaceae bacterium]
MKNIHHSFRNFLIILLLSPLLWQCAQGPSREELKEQNDSLAQLNTQKDSQMNQMVNTIGDIEATLGVIKEKEKIIALRSREGDTDEQTANEITEDIRMIYDLMVQNKERIESLEKQLEQSDVENNRLRKLIDNLNETLRQKNEEIQELNKLVKEKNQEIDNMHYILTDMELSLDSIKEANDQARDQLQSTQDSMYTGYYAIGTRKELKEKNIINQDGFLFFGKTELMKEDFDEAYFEPVDIRQTDSLELFQPRVEILTSHPAESFELKESENGNQVLVVNDKDEFWSVSKYLVVRAK